MHFHAVSDLIAGRQFSLRLHSSASGWLPQWPHRQHPLPPRSSRCLTPMSWAEMGERHRRERLTQSILIVSGPQRRHAAESTDATDGGGGADVSGASWRAMPWPCIVSANLKRWHSDRRSTRNVHGPNLFVTNILTQGETRDSKTSRDDGGPEKARKPRYFA